MRVNSSFCFLCGISVLVEDTFSMIVFTCKVNLCFIFPWRLSAFSVHWPWGCVPSAENSPLTFICDSVFREITDSYSYVTIAVVLLSPNRSWFEESTADEPRRCSLGFHSAPSPAAPCELLKTSCLPVEVCVLVNSNSSFWPAEFLGFLRCELYGQIAPYDYFNFL